MRRENRRPEFFPFFPAHWIASHAVQAMTPEERGCFIHLLAQSWLDADCSIPACHARIAAMCGIGRGWKRVSAAILREFPAHPTVADKLANPRLLKERELAEEQMQRKSKLRSDAANKRWGKDAGAMQVHCGSISSRNAPSRGTEQNGTERNRTESAARARDASPPARSHEFDPVVENLAALVESPPNGIVAKHIGSVRRRAGIAALVESLGMERVRSAIASMPDWAGEVAEIKSLWGRLATYDDSLDGEHGTNRIEQLERAVPRRKVDDEWGTPLDAESS